MKIVKIIVYFNNFVKLSSSKNAENLVKIDLYYKIILL